MHKVRGGADGLTGMYLQLCDKEMMCDYRKLCVPDASNADPSVRRNKAEASLLTGSLSPPSHSFCNAHTAVASKP